MDENVKHLAEDWIKRQPYFNPNAPDLINKVAEATGIIRELLAETAQLETRHHQHTYCAYCGEEFLADIENTVDEVEKHIWSCEKHPLQRLCHYIEEKCKDLDHEAQELLMTEKEDDLSHASGIHKSIDAVREALDDAKRYVVTLR